MTETAKRQLQYIVDTINDTLENLLKSDILRTKGGVSMTIRDKCIVAVKTADAINAIGGVPVSPFAKQLSKQWANGELTGEQMKAALLMRHRKLAEQERYQHEMLQGALYG